jgi:hypothetical protein
VTQQCVHEDSYSFFVQPCRSRLSHPPRSAHTKAPLAPPPEFIYHRSPIKTCPLFPHVSATATSLLVCATAKPHHGAFAVAPPTLPQRALRSSFLAVYCAHSRVSSPSILHADDSPPEATAAHPRLCLSRLAEEFRTLPSDADRSHCLLSLAAMLPQLPERDLSPSNRVTGCVAWV